jgi:hypothetical protein
MHFDKGRILPVEGFWSLKMDDAKYFFVANPLNRSTKSHTLPLCGGLTRGYSRACF